MKVGIIGAGFLGSAMHKLFGSEKSIVYDPYVVDKDHPMRPYTVSTTKDDINKTSAVFICVPTDGLPDGRLDTSIVEEIISWCESPLIIIRSTLNPGDTDYFSVKYKKRLVMQPEYTGMSEQHPFFDMSSRPFAILGGSDADTDEAINVYTKVYNANVNFRQMTALEAEIVKLSENRAIAFKVMQCHELYLACKKAGVSFYKIREAVYSDDPRFNLWFTFIYPELGFDNSHCLRKDVPAWCAWAESLGANADITKKLVLKSREWFEGNTYLVDITHKPEDWSWGKFFNVIKATGRLPNGEEVKTIGLE